MHVCDTIKRFELQALDSLLKSYRPKATIPHLEESTQNKDCRRPDVT